MIIFAEEDLRAAATNGSGPDRNRISGEDKGTRGAFVTFFPDLGLTSHSG
jgi:hypothetical protein